MTASHRVDAATGLAYEVRGADTAAPPILLLCPLGGSMALWGEFRDRLAERRTVIAFDYPGTGRSPAAPRWTTTQALARGALGLLDRLGLPRVSVFGSSLGGMVATWLAALAPARVETLCVASAPARGLQLTRMGLREASRLAACFARPRAEVEPALVTRVLSDRFVRERPDDVCALRNLTRRHASSRRVLSMYAVAGVAHDARPVLHQIAAPCLVLAGAEDRLLSHDASRRLARGMPDAAWEMVDRAGHAVALEQPLATAAHVTRFLAACRS